MISARKCTATQHKPPRYSHTPHRSPVSSTLLPPFHITGEREHAVYKTCVQCFRRSHRHTPSSDCRAGA